MPDLTKQIPSESITNNAKLNVYLPGQLAVRPASPGLTKPTPSEGIKNNAKPKKRQHANYCMCPRKVAHTNVWDNTYGLPSHLVTRAYKHAHYYKDSNYIIP